MRTFEFLFTTRNFGENWGDGELSITLRKVASDLQTAQRLANDYMVKQFGAEFVEKLDTKSIHEIN